MNFTYPLMTLVLMTALQATEDMHLPDLLTTLGGESVDSPEKWRQERRPEILELFRENIYGRMPVAEAGDMTFETVEENDTVLSGKATRKMVDIHFSGQGGKGTVHVTMFIPNDVPKPMPGFLLICNRSRDNIDPTREIKSPFWPVEGIIERGYATAAFHYSEVAPDDPENFLKGVCGIVDPKDDPRPADAWGAIAAWAWGAGRVMDYFEIDGDIDQSRIAVVGHSRGGKTALWCGAEDERFALTISNNSGCTGAALARRKKGESLTAINTRFSHWFCDNYNKFNDNEDQLPVDQHMLIALIAPRLVYVASASEDGWADPLGEFLSCVHAGPVYKLHGLKPMNSSTMPNPEEPLHEGSIGYHLRSGKHNLTEYDWNCYMDFADGHWKMKEIRHDEQGLPVEEESLSSQ